MPKEQLYGIHAVHAALDAGELEEIWVATERHTDERIVPLLEKARALNLSIHELRHAALARKFNTDKHQGIAGVLLQHPEPDFTDILADLNGQGFLLVLDGVLDPHNLGACLRSAEAAGVSAVILPRDNACPVNATVRKAAAGSASRLPVCTVTNLSRTLASLQEAGFWLVGMAGDAPQNIYDLDLSMPLVMVMGGEQKGLRRLTREHCDYLAHIPMAGAIESLNVSVATGICLFEASRQRQCLKTAATV
ncbi:23S rRNA (guanosine(2251)-2'-O)-methyltransferase RlmB [Acidithiobacillus thiooxidans]|uniref:23S rRNA (Guanosine-2'-O-)-methyltransferase RlmB n=1 Tax=Acidithiobacillus thiooxidans ATCC 19377 TaxID=637390 RepID=A0A543Q7B8_ACITH|nr:23S rRNA (guanosine(2251)-2'-O)-methyltransferase RlmB [Acidithiobacillus thiooxidans]MDR7926299.1 23S rRNA (guanosine(2251)-2'-O)-methyltransferase RlmB [Acidithiobacillus thiooxidans]MDX5936276.1 23S rRNA (guanosine(2251)-2'-O)-methyltransferase RlmB [Acidithiobacillus thiooxidans]TQN52219.1 23S rRNA (guanosine-2'-O-)-methyltransferase RlmB [Acidithiobacillus thiooxidans ATCC 19377]